MLAFIQQIEASPKAKIHKRITRKKQLALTRKLHHQEHIHPEKTLSRVKQVHNDLSHNFWFKMKVRRSIYMISHSLLTLKSVNLALHGLNHSYTSYSHHNSSILTFTIVFPQKMVQNIIIPSHKWRDDEHLLWFISTLSQKGLKTLKKYCVKKPQINTMGHYLGSKNPRTIL